MRTTSIIGAVILSLVMAPHVQAASGCNHAQKGESEGGAGGTWQQTPGQKAEAEGGAGGNWQQSPPGAAQSTQAQANAGGTQVASAEPCK